MLDARIASALRKIISNSNFNRRVSVEEQAQKHNPFLRGRQLAYMIYGHFQATGACDAAQGSSDLFNTCLQNHNVQDFDTRWDQILLQTSEMPPETVLEGLYRRQGHAISKPGMRECRREDWSKVKKGEMSARREKWEDAFSGRQLDSVRKGILVFFFTTGPILVERKKS